MLSRLRDCAVGEMVHDATGVLSLSPKTAYLAVLHGMGC
jgi:hypothetical protein